MVKHFVYKVINKVNGKFYIGKHSTDNLNDGYYGSGLAIRNAIKKYGKDSFERIILKFFPTAEEAYMYEAEIVTQEVVANKNCYNEKPGGFGGCAIGHPVSEETKEKIRAKLMGHSVSEETRKKISGHQSWQKGLTVKDETKEKIRAKLMGHSVSEETRKKISESLKKNDNEVSKHAIYMRKYRKNKQNKK